MDKKFGRSYLINIEKGTTTTPIRPPLTIEFDILKKTLGSANHGVFRIYNLSENTRSTIGKDPQDYELNERIIFKAGYGNSLVDVFYGYVREAQSFRDGNNFITNIEANDWTSLLSSESISFSAKTPKTDVISALIEKLKNAGVNRGVVNTPKGSLLRGNSYSGSVTEILKEITGGEFFIDNGKAYVLAENECYESGYPVIDSSAGLLGTPRRYDSYLVFNMIFEPRISIGQKIVLESSTFKSANGTYKVAGLHHRGTISEAVCGSAITTVELFWSRNLTVLS